MAWKDASSCQSNGESTRGGLCTKATVVFEADHARVAPDTGSVIAGVWCEGLWQFMTAML